MRYDEQIAKIKTVINQPMRKFKPDALRGVIERYEANHQRSREIFERMR